MKVNFYKMNGAGNEFVIVDNSRNEYLITKSLIEKMSNKTTGPGCDQFISIEKINKNNVDIKIWNKDGSTAEACGNASRCVAKIMFEKKHVNEINLNMHSLRHICNLTEHGDIRVNMGKAQTQWKKIPTTFKIDNTLHFNYDFQITPLKNIQDVCLVNIGNPHIIFFCKNLSNLNVNEIGPKIENHEIFPERINVSFANIIDRNNIDLIVWERGAGITKACGTAAAAVAFAANKLDLSETNVYINLPGGKLQIDIDIKDNIFKSGPAELEYIDEFVYEESNG